MLDVVEHGFGILKMLFPALLYGLRKYKAINSQATIFAAVVLYNLTRDFNDDDPVLPQDLSNQEFDRLIRSTRINVATRQRDDNKFVRDQIIETYFT